MSILHSSQALTGSSDDQKKFLKSLVVSWIEETQPALRLKTAQLRREEGFEVVTPPIPYEVIVVPPGLGLISNFKQVLRDLSSALGVAFDFREAQDLSGQDQASSLLRAAFPERLGEGPALQIAILDSRLPTDTVLEASSAFPGLLIRRYHSANAQVFGEASQLEQLREERLSVNRLQQAARDGRHSQGEYFAAGPEVAAALRVVGVEIGKGASDHPVAALAQQDPALAALYVAARALQLRANPPQPPSGVTNGSDPALLEAVVYHEEKGMIGPLMASRVLRRAPGMMEELERSQGDLSILMARAHELAAFPICATDPETILVKLKARVSSVSPKSSF